ncbi:MAG: hypothetical protein AAFP79_05050 [Pseudomonadota bacterium]
MDWTPERVATLRRLVDEEGLGPTAIAERLPCTVAAVKRKMSKLGLRVPKRDREVIKADFLEQLAECGEVADACLLADVGRTAGFAFLREARAELGWQAQ